MESELRAALIDWLHADPNLAGVLNAVTEEAPTAASPPWLAIAASPSADWSPKTQAGRELRIALELHCRGGDARAAIETGAAVESRVQALPRAQNGFAIASLAFVRARAEQRPRGQRAILMEYRFRCLETQPE
jgi:hypothetical protein